MNEHKSQSQILKPYVQGLMEQAGYEVVDYARYKAMSGEQMSKLGERILVKNYRYVDASKQQCMVDFFDVKNRRVVECKYQFVSGSAREKMLYAAVHLALQPFDSLIVYEGGAYDKSMVSLTQRALKAFCQVEGVCSNKVKVVSLSEFESLID